jgi:hypothetical protein
MDFKKTDYKDGWYVCPNAQFDTSGDAAIRVYYLVVKSMKTFFFKIAQRTHKVKFSNSSSKTRLVGKLYNICS